MSKLTRISEGVLVQLNSLDEEQINQLTYLSKPIELIDNTIIRTDTYNDVDLEIDEQVISKVLVDNIDDDLTCAIKLYQTFKRINYLTLLDNKLWTYYSTDAFWEYTFKRWLKGNTTENSFRKHALLVNSKVENLLNNSISRLWWTAHLTRDPNKEDKYELTSYILKNDIFLETLFLLPQFSKREFVKKFFDAYHLVDDTTWVIKKEDTQFVRGLFEYISYLSLFSMIDLYEIADLLKIVEQFYEDEYTY